MANSSLSEAEERHMAIFKFNSIVPPADQVELRSFLHKLSFNLNHAYMYLSILDYLIDYKKRKASKAHVEVAGFIYETTFISFVATVRRIFDKLGKRSLRKLVLNFTKDSVRDKWVSQIDVIYMRYKPITDKMLFHQDEEGVSELLTNFPDSDIVRKNLDFATQIYEQISIELCSATKKGGKYEVYRIPITKQPTNDMRKLRLLLEQE